MNAKAVKASAKLNFTDPTVLPALFVSMAEIDSVAEQMIGMVTDLVETDMPLESKQNVLTEAQQVLSKTRKDSPAMQTAYQYSSRAKTIFGAVEQGFVPAFGRNCAGIYADAQKFLKDASVNWKGEPVTPKAEKSPDGSVTSAAMAAPIGDVTAALETVENHAAHLLATKGPEYAIELIAVLTGMIDAQTEQQKLAA